VTSWAFAVAGVLLLLVLIGRETDTEPASGSRIALMLVPAAIALLLMPSAVRDPWPHPVAAATFALIWILLSGLHPGRVWRKKGAPGRRRAFGALWVSVVAAVVVLILGY
jgi:hypothetical protein